MIDNTTPDDRAQPSHRTSTSRGLLIAALRVVVSLGLLYLLLSKVPLVKVWEEARTASVSWLAVAVLVFALSVLVSSWRWGLLLAAQGIAVAFRALVSSFLVANFFNNFLPSNIGGDVVRVADTTRAAGSRTLATTVVLIDRGIGLIGLILTAALGATVTSVTNPAMFGASPDQAQSLLVRVVVHLTAPATLWLCFLAANTATGLAFLSPDSVGRLLKPLRIFHAEWVEERIVRLTAALGRFRESPKSLVGCLFGAVAVQALLVLFYAAIASSLGIAVSNVQLALIVPVTFVVQMLPISMNGLGVREATFAFYFSRLGIQPESAIALSLIGAALTTLFSLSGGVVYLSRRR